MTVAVSSVWRASDPGSAASIATTQTLTSGAFLIVVVECDTSRTVSGVSDGTNTYTQRLGPVTESGMAMRWYVFTAENVSGGSKTITASFAGGNSAHSWMLIQQVTGQATTAYDTSKIAAQTPVGSTATDAITTGTSSNTAQPALVWGFCAGSGGTSSGTGFSFGTFGSDAVNNGGTSVSWVTENKRVTSTGSQAATWTTGNGSDNTISIMVVVDELVAATSRPTAMLMGVG